MLFKRRKPLPWSKRMRSVLWPQRSWKRSSRYFQLRLSRLEDTPHSVALGFAVGTAMAVTPFVGLHYLLAALAAWLLRANVLASVIGTSIGNPWTLPFLLVWDYQIGSALLGGGGAVSEQHLTLAFMFRHPLDMLAPLVIGSIPTAAVLGGLSYVVVRRIVAHYRTQHQETKRRRHAARIDQHRGSSACKPSAELGQ